MRIVEARLYRYSLPLTSPLDLRGTEVCRREGVLIKLQSDDGRVGWGDAAPLPGYSAETIAEVASELPQAVRRLSSAELRSGEGWWLWSCQTGLAAYCPAIVSGLEAALMSLGGAHATESSIQLDLAGFHMPVRVNGLLSGAREEVLRDVKILGARGYDAFKLKVGRHSLAADIELACAVLSLLPEHAVLRLDANRAWGLREAVRFGKAVGPKGIAYLEEPLSDPGELPAFFSATGIPVALDESLRELDPENLEGRNDIGAVILKPTLLGGMNRARQWAEKAVELQITPVVSSSFESGVGILGLARLACTLARPEVAVGLDTYRWLGRDVVTPRLRFDRGALQPSPGEGAVYALDFSRLQEIPYV